MSQNILKQQDIHLKSVIFQLAQFFDENVSLFHCFNIFWDI